MVGQYPFAAIVGKVLDTRGPRVCSLIAALMFSVGFGLFAYEIADAPEYPQQGETAQVFRRMVVYFGMVGLGTVFSCALNLPHLIRVHLTSDTLLPGTSQLFSPLPRPFQHISALLQEQAWRCLDALPFF